MLKTAIVLIALGVAHGAQGPAPAPSAGPSGPFQLVPLPYAYDALEPVIDARTMMIHHDKHLQAYVTNLNTVLANPSYSNLATLSLSKMLAAVNTSALPPAIATAVRNNAGGIANHNVFFKLMTSPSSSNATNGPMGSLGEAINSTWGNFTTFKTQFNKQGADRFGSGFAWLILLKNGSLAVTSTANQDNTLMTELTGVMSGIPILGNDVWEHAYYLKYQNQRPMYLTEWWKVVNWQQAEANYLAAKNGDNPFEATY